MKTNYRIAHWFILLHAFVLCGPLARAQSSGPGSALNFDGASGYAQVTNGVWFSGNFTVEGWVYARSYNNWSRLFDFGNSGYLQEVYLALSEGTGGYPKMGVFTNGNYNLVGSSQQLPLNQWTHLAVTLSGSTATILMNGNPVGSGTVLVPNSVLRTNNYIGRSLFAGDAYANALFDELRIWNVARTQGQIQVNMHRSLVGDEPGLIGYWRMDENTGSTLSDSTGHKQTATLFGGTTWTNSTAPIVAGPGSALNFNAASGQYVTIPHQTALNAYPLTVTAWFQAPNSSGSGALVNKYVSSSHNGYQIFMSGGHLLGWYFRDSGNNVFSGGPMDAGAVNDGLWHHAAMVIEATGGRLYLDGVLKSSLPWTGAAGPVTTTQPLSLGLYPGDSFFSGQLDEVGIWNTALSAEQIQAAMNRKLLGTEVGLLGYWPLDEGSGSNAMDATTNGYNGTLGNSPAWVTSGAGVAASDPAYALHFDGSNAYVDIPGFGSVAPTNEVTIEFWQRAEALQNQSTLSCSPDLSNNRINVHLPWSDGKVYWDFGDITTRGRLSYTPSSTIIGSWQHFAFVASQGGNYMAIYQNGVQVALKFGMTPFTRAGQHLIFGGIDLPGGLYFKGNLDEVRIWSIARSAGQIRQTMNSPLKGTEPGLVAYWRLDDGIGAQIVDATGRGYNGNFAGSVTPTWSVSQASITNVNANFQLGTGALAEGPAAGTDGVLLTVRPQNMDWVASSDASWLHLSQANRNGTGSTNVVFSFDANPGATRIGTLTIAGKMLTVTQAGANYVPAGLTTVVSGDVANPYSVAVDSLGNLYVANTGFRDVLKWDATDQSVAFLLDGAPYNGPVGIAVDSPGNIYFGCFDPTLQEWSPITHQVTTLVPSGLNEVSGIAVDTSGNVYFSDVYSLHELNASNHTLTTLASPLNGAGGVAVDIAGNVYFSEPSGGTVKKWIAASQTVTTLVAAGLNYPNGLALDPVGNVYIGDMHDHVLRKWDAANQSVTTVLSSGLNTPAGVAMDAAGNIFISDPGDYDVKELPRAFVDNTPRIETRFVGNDSLPSVVPAAADLTGLFSPTSDQPWLTITSVTNGVVSYAFNASLASANRTAHITLLSRQISVTLPDLLLGSGSLLEAPSAGSDGVSLTAPDPTSSWAASANASWLHLVTTNGTGSTNIVFTFDANAGATRIGTISVGNQTLTVTQAGATYVAAAPVSLVTTGLNKPYGVAVDSGGNVYIADAYNFAIKKWSVANNAVTTLVSLAANHLPYDVAVDGAGNLYFTVQNYVTVMKWTAANGTLTTLASQPQISGAVGVAVDGAGNVFIADGASAISEWKADDQSVTNLVTGLNIPHGVAVDGAGNVYIADTGNSAIKRWTAAGNAVSTLASSGLNHPTGVAIDQAGNVFIADYANHAVEEWPVALATLNTLVPSGLYYPQGVALDSAGNVYIADSGNDAVKELAHAFVDAAVKTENAAAGTDVLGPVLPATENMSGPFTPTSDQPWLTIGTIANGAVSFSFRANTGASRTAHITLFGVSITINQVPAVTPMFLTGARMLSNGAFQFSFTNDPGGSFTIITTTNVSLPLSQWTVAGVPTNVAPGVFQFTLGPATNGPRRFYSVQSP